MLIYEQATGEIREFKGRGEATPLLARGYAGTGSGRNNPAAERQARIGPVPRGFWRIGKSYTSTNTGPVTIPLYKLDGDPTDDIDDVTGRSLFRIHGNNARNDASQGCIIADRPAREAIDRSDHEILWVV